MSRKGIRGSKKTTFLTNVNAMRWDRVRFIEDSETNAISWMIQCAS